MMPDMPRAAIAVPLYTTAAATSCGSSAQSVRVLDAVRRKLRLDGSRTAFGVGGLHAKEHELRALHRASFGAGRDANEFVEGLSFEPEPLTLDRLNVLRAPD